MKKIKIVVLTLCLGSIFVSCKSSKQIAIKANSIEKISINQNKKYESASKMALLGMVTYVLNKENRNN